MDLQIGKLPAEAAARRKVFMAKQTALQDKVHMFV